MKNILILLFFPLFSYSQTFNYTKLVNGKDTVERKGQFLIQELGDVTHYTLFPEPIFGIDEFTNISFLVHYHRTYIRTKDLIYFKDFLDADYLFNFGSRIVIRTATKEIQFLK